MGTHASYNGRREIHRTEGLRAAHRWNETPSSTRTHSLMGGMVLTRNVFSCLLVSYE